MVVLEGGGGGSYERGTPVGFRVQGLAFRVSGLGFRVECVRSKPQRPGFRVYGLRGTVTSTMRRAAHSSGCARCGDGAGCSAITYQSMYGLTP